MEIVFLCIGVAVVGAIFMIGVFVTIESIVDFYKISCFLQKAKIGDACVPKYTNPFSEKCVKVVNIRQSSDNTWYIKYEETEGEMVYSQPLSGFLKEYKLLKN